MESVKRLHFTGVTEHPPTSSGRKGCYSGKVVSVIYSIYIHVHISQQYIVIVKFNKTDCLSRKKVPSIYFYLYIYLYLYFTNVIYKDVHGTSII